MFIIIKSMQSLQNTIEQISSNKIIIEQNKNYKGLPINSKNSKFSSLTVDPIYKFPIISKRSFPYYLIDSQCYFPDSTNLLRFYEYLHYNSPFKQKKETNIKEPFEKNNPKNTIYYSNLNSISSTKNEKPFDLIEALKNENISIDSPSLSSGLNLSLSPDRLENVSKRGKSLKNKYNFSPKRDELRINSVSSINLSQVRDSLINGAEQILNFSNVEISGLENESRRLYQKIDDQVDIPSNDEALFTGTKTDESLRKNPYLVELVAETDEENSWLMYKSIEALKTAKILQLGTEEDRSPSDDDEGPLKVDTGRLFLNGETASKSKLSGAVSMNRVIQKITQKVLTDSSDLILSTVPETQPSIDFPDMLSPLLKKMVILEGNKDSAKIISAIATSGFNSSLIIEYSSEDDLTKAYPSKKDPWNDLWSGLLNSKCLNILLTIRIQWISCGFEHMTAVSIDGKVLSWGYGGSGCLGHGNTLSIFYPTFIRSLLPERILYLECGGYHNVAVNEEGDVWVWGRGDVNQLGVDCFQLQTDEIGVVALNPIRLDELSEHGIVIKAVACGEAHTLLLDSEGKVYSFGWSEDGQLGTSIAETQSSFLHKTINIISGLFSKIVKISAGSTFSACISEFGHVFVWGNGEQGQLGQGNYLKSSRLPIIINSLCHEFIIDIICGESHVICIAQSEKIYAWGQGIAGFFPEQCFYPIGSDIICFASRSLLNLKNYQEFVIQESDACSNLDEAVTKKLKNYNEKRNPR